MDYDSDIAPRLSRDQEQLHVPAKSGRPSGRKAPAQRSVKEGMKQENDGISRDVRGVAGPQAVDGPIDTAVPMGQQQADQQQGQVEIRGESSSSKEQQASNSSSSAIACEDSQQLQQCRVRASQHPAMSLEAAAVHALCAGAGWLAVKVAKSFRRKQPSTEAAPGAPATQEVEVQELTAKLAALQARLEQEEGDHSATRSENELMKREMDRLRSQLEAAQRQTERYHATARQTRAAANDGYAFEEDIGGYFDDFS